MPDTIGRIEVPEIAPLTGAFPLVTDYAHGCEIKRQAITHLIGNPTGKVEQSFYLGSPAPRYTFVRRTLSNGARSQLAQWWQNAEGGVAPFEYSVPQPDQTFVTKLVRFEDVPLSLDDLAGSICSTGLTFVEIPDPDDAPVYTSTATLTRFPNSALATGLLAGAQDIIPLVRIRVAEEAVPDIFLSDRRCTVDGQLYQPRLLRIGEPGSDVLMAQSIDGGTDETQFSFGNADRVMVQLANDTELKWARIELSLYHVATGYLLNLWAGRIIDWSSDGGPEFVVQASDPLSALTLSSPVGTCSRTCWRRYGQDGCPAVVGSQDLDTEHFPSADNSWCDLGYDTPNGCLAHSAGSIETKFYFGGTPAKPQQVKVLDNSTGTWGIGRNLITPTSQINDSLYGQSLPEIWHNDDGIPQRALPVTCRIAAGREESDFYDALGVVGAGPIGAFTTATMVDTDGDGTRETFIGSTLDGQPHHGWKVDDSGTPSGDSLGLRQCLGTDPAGDEDYFSLGRVGTAPTSWREVAGTDGSVYEDTYAAGVAFQEIRRVDEKGVQLSTPQSHSMVAMISKGLTGLTWTAPGTRGTTAGCTNPFWVAVNTYLRALGITGLTASAQEAYFDVSAAGTCAESADLTVNRIIGDGTETQFRFKGTIDNRKPCRDWIRDILSNGLGYFTWSFGKLRLGMRINAVAATNFTSGNIIWGSLRLEPIKPAFEKLTVEFADEEYLFSKNTVDYCDQDHAARHGRIANPLTSQAGLVGCSTKSQAARLAVVRTREELGGVTAAEQRNARLASWKTTILALDTEAGQVVKLYDDDLDGGFGRFRIQSWRLNRDWSVDIVAKTVTESMYDLTTGKVPAAVSAAIQPTQGPRDSGPPPEPDFSLRVCPVDPCSLEIYDLSFAQITNTRTISSVTFTIDFETAYDPLVVTVHFPPDFFMETTGAAEWTKRIYLPGKVVTSVTAYATNDYGNSPQHTETGDIALEDSVLTTEVLSADLPLFGDGTVKIKTGTKTGNTNKVVTSTGTLTSQDLAMWDADGNAVDAEVAVSVDDTFAANSDALLPTQKAITAYVAAHSGSSSGWSPYNGSVAPIYANFTAINQETATIDHDDDTISIYAPPVSGHHCRMMSTPAPGGNFTFEAGITAILPPQESTSAGIFVMDSAGKFVNWALLISTSAFRLNGGHWASPTSNITNPAIPVMYFMGHPTFLRVVLDSTNFNFGYSCDRKNWVKIFTEAKSAYLTGAPDRIGFYCNTYTNTYGCGVTCFHFLAV